MTGANGQNISDLLLWDRCGMDPVTVHVHVLYCINVLICLGYSVSAGTW